MPRLAPLDWRTLECIFLRAGFQFENQEGSHRVYPRKGTLRAVVIPAYREIPVFVIQNNLKTAGITREEYFRLLAECR
jgi:predicted RNA binding protein YcfA (HicA-like mRNA interferase family)